MSADTLLRAAMDAGVELKFIGGKLKAVGPLTVVRCWAPKLREHKSELIEALTGAPDWRALDRAYQAHHVTCGACQAAGRGSVYGRRCGVGASLWAAYRETTST